MFKKVNVRNLKVQTIDNLSLIMNMNILGYLIYKL